MCGKCDTAWVTAIVLLLVRRVNQPKRSTYRCIRKEKCPKHGSPGTKSMSRTLQPDHSSAGIEVSPLKVSGKPSTLM